MRATCRSSRHACARHNDRNFDIANAEHIDAARTKKNYYWHISKDKSLTFEEMELEYYKRHFSAYLEARNENNKAKGHAERVISMKEYMHKQRSCPEEVLLQIGSLKDGSASAEILHKCMREYVIEFNKRYGKACTVLNMAVHVDEATPHVHIRRVWHVRDRNGHEVVNQKQGLAELGFERPDTTKKEDRRNNAKIPFSAEERKLFLDICEAHGLELEREPLEGRKRMETDIFKLQAEMDKKKTEIKELESLFIERRTQADIKLNEILKLQVELDEKKAELQELESLVKSLQKIIEGLQKKIVPLAKSILNEHEKKQKHDIARSR